MKQVLIVFVAFILYFSAHAQINKRIVVAKDGTGDVTTVQEALNKVPLNNHQRIEIFIRAGVYHEKLLLDSTKDMVTLIGDKDHKTILTYDDHTGKTSVDGSVINTMNSQSFYIRANDFKAIDIVFGNNAGLTAGQAVAVRVEGDKAFFDRCVFTGFQDVLFTSGDNSRQYYHHCRIEGSTDFIFGSSTALFDSCVLHSRKNSHVTAASTPADHAYGYVFRNCILTADSGINKVSLGRPWRPYASVTYLNCIIGAHIIPAGWDNWKNSDNEKTTRYAEYKSTGPGANPINRATWAKQLTDTEAKEYTMKNILRGWIPE